MENTQARRVATMPYEACHQMRDILDEVANERKRQYDKWGYQDVLPAQFALILGEEVGEVNQEIIETHFHGWNPEQAAHLRKELIQVAAVAVQFLQVLDDKVDALNRSKRLQQNNCPPPAGYDYDPSTGLFRIPATTKHNPLTSDQPEKDNG